MSARTDREHKDTETVYVGTWLPGLRNQLEAEGYASHLDSAVPDDPSWEDALMDLARDGNVEALAALREELLPIDYDELGWGD